jgi:5-(aminomethyl)-3-furanmethanol phosphate kinase
VARDVDAVVKVGGGLLGAEVDAASPGRQALAWVMDTLGALAATRRLVVVPGGGPFADAVRAADARQALGESEAHWMAVLAMEQMAHLLAAGQAGARLADDAPSLWAALDAGRLAVLAPYHWLRAADPLPHSWAVTSDSIAAWFAGELGAPRLVLVKPVAGELSAMVDEHFPHALPAGVRAVVVGAEPAAHFPAALARALDG